MMKEFSLYRSLLLLIVLCFAAIGSVCAQVAHGGMPYPDVLPGKRMLRSTSVVPFEVMPSFDRDSLLREDSLPGNRFGAIRFANKFLVSIDMEHSGLTSILDDGTKVWRVGITSKGAYSLNVLFSEFNIPNQARLFIYSPDRSSILGSFTAQNRQQSGVFPIAPIDGDSIIIEYIEPSSVDFHGKLKVGEVNHDYLGLRTSPAWHQSAVCELDVVCNPIHLDQKRSACLIVVDGASYCSGNLINNTAEDGKPYVLTASHCLYEDLANPLVVDSKAESSVFFFNYETPYCYSDIQGNIEQSVAGATVKASYAQRDMLLLQMNEMPPIDYRPYYAGWNATEDISAPAYCFHHPIGDIKSLSIENDVPYTASFYKEVFKSKSHWKIDLWDEGITENGSSGSGLFDANDRLIGALSGGGSFCGSAGADFFYKLNMAWTGNVNDKDNLKPWLDPKGTGIQKMDGMEFYKEPCVRLSNIKNEDLLLPTQPSAEGYAAGQNSYGYLSYAERFEVDDVAAVYGVYFIPYMGRYSEAHPISMKIYSGTDFPKTLLHEQKVRLSCASYKRGVDNFSEEILSEFNNKENYLRLDSVVSVEQSFFVVFELPATQEDDFALYYAGGRSADEGNSAFFLDDGIWKPFTQNPLLNAPSSLYVDVVLQNKSSSSIKDTWNSKQEAVAYQDGEGNVNLLFHEKAGKKEIFLYDFSGRLLSHSEVEMDRCTLPVKAGMFVVRIVYPDYTEVLKFFKE